MSESVLRYNRLYKRLNHERELVSTARNVAREAGVSVATVSQVINGTHYGCPESHQVLDAIMVGAI